MVRVCVCVCVCMCACVRGCPGRDQADSVAEPIQRVLVDLGRIVPSYLCKPSGPSAQAVFGPKGTKDSAAPACHR